jgi:hypothetical protein
VLASLRLLAEAAKDFHDASPSDNYGFAPPSNNAANVAISNARLFKAVSTVGGHILMLSENQHMSEENVIRVRTELAEHDLQLDAIEGRIQEAGFRLTLGDLKAFHSSGITDADIKSLEAAFLGVIAAKQ